MNNIKSSNVYKPTILNKTLAGFTCILTASAIALLIIGLIEPKGNPFNTISQLGLSNNAILLGTSIFLLILDLVWIAAIKKHGDKPTVVLSNPMIESSKPPIKPSKPIVELPKAKIRTVLIRQLPEAIDKQILTYLLPETAISCVNKSWQMLTHEEWKSFKLKKLFPKVTVISKKFWKRQEFSFIGIDLSDVNPISDTEKRIMFPVLKKLFTKVEGDAGMTILTIPRGLSFNKLLTLARSLVKQHGTIFKSIVPEFIGKFGDILVDKTYRVVITNNVLLDSRNKSIQDQKGLVDRLGIGCEFPKVIEMVTLLIATLINSNKRLFNDDILTYSLCQEGMYAQQLIVGSFQDNGFSVNSCHDPYESYGVAGRREF